jgi:fumarate reductase subunit C
VSDRHVSTPYHARWHRARTSTYWWLERPSYFRFILRELSSLFVAWSVLYFLKLLWALAHDEFWYRAFLLWSSHPAVVVLNVVTFLFVVFHAVTWFNLAPKAMVVDMGGRRVPGVLVAAANYGAWAAITIGLAWVLLGA